MLNILFVCLWACLDLRTVALSEDRRNPHCFEKVSITAVSSQGLTVWARVPDIGDIRQCAELCILESRCVAAHVGSSCDLISYISPGVPGVEVSKPAVPTNDLWLMSERVRNHCPDDFTLKWRSSRYKLFKTNSKWPDAQRQCEGVGATLAELTTNVELKALQKLLTPSIFGLIFVGAIQERGQRDPTAKWTWYKSRIPIPTPGFNWATGEPNDYNTDEIYASWKLNENIFFDTLGNELPYLCECSNLVQ